MTQIVKLFHVRQSYMVPTVLESVEFEVSNDEAGVNDLMLEIKDDYNGETTYLRIGNSGTINHSKKKDKYWDVMTGQGEETNAMVNERQKAQAEVAHAESIVKQIGLKGSS